MIEPRLQQGQVKFYCDRCAQVKYYKPTGETKRKRINYRVVRNDLPEVFGNYKTLKGYKCEGCGQTKWL